jgi:hypothetical protein
MERMAADGGEDGGLVVGEVELQHVEVARRRPEERAAARHRGRASARERQRKGRRGEKMDLGLGFLPGNELYTLILLDCGLISNKVRGFSAKMCSTNL